MTTSSKLQSAGFSAEKGKAILGDVDGSVTATGSSQSDAYTIKGGVTVITGGAGTTGVVLPVSAASDSFEIINTSGSNKIIYPPSGGAFNNGSTDVGVTLATDSSFSFLAYTTIDFVYAKDTSGLSNIVEDTTPQLGGDLDLNGFNIDFPTTPNIDDVIDDDTFATADAFNLATAESIKAYVDAQIASVPTNYLENIVEDTTPQLGGDLSLNGKNIDFPTTANISDCLDDDTMATASATTLATSESIKAYVDSQTGSGFGSGTRMLFHQTLAPTGWTRDEASTYNNVGLRVMASGTWVGGPTGSIDFSTLFASGKATSSDLSANVVSHTHQMAASTGTGLDGQTYNARIVNSNNQYDSDSGPQNTGGPSYSGIAHSHTTNLAVKYTDVIIASKDP